MSSPYEIIGKNLFKKETNIQLFVNLKVTLSTGETGLIEGHFGQSGKLKIRFMGKELITLFIHQLPGNFLFIYVFIEGLKESTQSLLNGLKKKKPSGNSEEKAEQVRILLSFKRYIYDPQKKMIQT